MATVPQTFSVNSAIFADLDMSQLDDGLPLDWLTEFVNKSGISMGELCQIVIPARTLKHRRAKGQNLSRDESDKLMRALRIYQHTSRVFGDPDKTLRFLSKPKESFAGKTPLQMMQTEFGGLKVEEMLWQIADGMFV